MMSIATAACTVCTPAAALAAHATTPSAPTRAGHAGSAGSGKTNTPLADFTNQHEKLGSLPGKTDARAGVADGLRTVPAAAPAVAPAAASSGVAHVVRPSNNPPKHLANSVPADAPAAPTAVAAVPSDRSAAATAGNPAQQDAAQDETVSYPQMTVVEPGVAVTIKPTFMRGDKEITLAESKKYGPCHDNYEYISVEYKNGDKYELAYGSAITRSEDYSYTFKWRASAAREHPNAIIRVKGLRMYDKEGHQLQEEVIPTFKTAGSENHKVEPKPFEFNKNELSAGLATDKNGNYVRWRVLSNSDSPSNDEQAYCSKFLDYDPDAHILKTKIIDNTVPPINNRAPSVVAKRFIGITLQTMGMNDTVPVTENLENTPWFFKDAKERVAFESTLHNKVWSKQYDYDQYSILQQIGGKLPKGVTYNLSKKAFEGNPEINDWQENEDTRNYPLYLAQVTMYDTADYLTLKPYTSYTARKPNPQSKPSEAKNFSDTPVNVVSTGLSADKKLRWRILSDDLPKGIDKSKVTYNSATKRFEPLFYEGLSEDQGVIAQVSNLTLETIDANGHTTKYQKTPVFVYKNEDSHKKVLVISDAKKRIGNVTVNSAAGSLNYIVAGDLPNGVSFNSKNGTFSGKANITDWKNDENSRSYPIYVATYKSLNGTTFLHFVDDSITIVRNADGKTTPVTPQPVVPPAPQPSVTPQPKPSDTAANVLVSGTATDKSGKQVQWQVINNDTKPDKEQMKRYAQYLSYNPDTNALTMTDAAAFTENGKAISARKFSNITLKVTKDGTTTEESIKETPWFFKDQNSKNMWDSINQTTIGTYTFAKYNLEQRVGGKGLEGLSYDFLNKNFDGTPTITWKHDETSREIPVYIASIHKGEDSSDYMSVGELKKFKAYKNRDDIFEGTPGTNPRTQQPYKFSDLGDDNVTKTVTAMYADGPIYLKAGETKTVPLKFYLVDANRKPITDITDEFMKVLAPEPHESTITKVLLTRNRQTSLMDMNVSYVLHTDYSITFTANKNAEVGDSYNTDGSKLDNLPMALDPTVTPNYTYEPGITLHKKGEPGHVAFINAFFDVIPGKPDPKPKPPVPPAPKPPVPPQPTPQPPVEPPAPTPTPVVPAPEPPAPTPTPAPELPAVPTPAPTPSPKPEPPAAPTPAPVPTPAIRRVPALPRTNDVFAHMGEVCGALTGVSAVLIAAGCGMLGRKRKAR